MSVRKRQWTTGNGLAKEAWVVDYADAKGKRRLKTFPRKKEADSFAATATVEVREGTHVADSASATMAQAGALWLARAKAHPLERATTETYWQYLTYHIEPFIGGVRLSRFTAPAARAFEDQLRNEGRSPFMVRRVMRTLGSILADAQERGLIVRNVARELKTQRRGRGSERKGEQRQRGKLKVGVDIPTPEEIRSIVAHAKGRWRPLLITAILTGLRASELRGLRWQDVDLKGRTLHVRQRADRFNVIGPPKSEAGERTIPLPPIVVAELREWGEPERRGTPGHSPKSSLDLVFPTGAGKVESLGNIINRGLKPTLVAAGVTVLILDGNGDPRFDAEGKPMVRAKYTGLHSLRHFFASWCINRRADGGLELPAKLAQERLGHASIAMTLDTYGHLFPRGDDLAELESAERALLGGG